MKNYSKLFMDIAERTAIESNCVKYKVGAVIVRDNRIILQGYNGTISGFINCNEKFPDYNHFDSNKRSNHTNWANAFEIHSEMNIICYAAKRGISLEDTIMYCTLEPCNNCLKHMIQAGIKKVVFKNNKNDNSNLDDRKSLMNFIEIEKY